ncbi:hypothetical protein CANARDRAFT_23679 [[Candida] arabinofermentans NRRL YB-2248]|uniref:SBE2/SBE22 middle domain-containing protein n=1 Tax=[Candida] arabinofermentans NRRL YB-2248 TaxID=983967 RepID=A0A1E4SYW3_9ASCO|nr:hypothetical protein CANARDRAFT_23679 [[Candida] arabinofermentans NRRL YB-2248]
MNIPKSLLSDDLLDIPISSNATSNGNANGNTSSTPTVTNNSNSKPTRSNLYSNKGLGIKIPKRPSDTVLNTINSKTSSSQSTITPPHINNSSEFNRPISTDTSDGSDFTSQPPSRLSSISSLSSAEYNKYMASSSSSSATATATATATASTTSQTPSRFTTHQMKFQSMPSLIYQKSQSTISSSTTLNQYKLKKKIFTKSSKADKYKIYDELDDGDDNLISDDTNIYNVPLSMSSTTSLIRSANILTSKTETNLVIPPSPIPGIPNSDFSMTKNNGGGNGGNGGIKSPKLSKYPSYNGLSPTAKHLTNFYEFSINSHVDAEYKKRSKLINKIPSTTNSKDLEDFKLISQEKLSNLSITRPTWLPPKDKHESWKHEKEFQKIMTKHSLTLQKDSLINEQRERDRMIGDARLIYLTTKNKISNSNHTEIKKLIWRSLIEPNARFEIFQHVIKLKYDENLNIPETNEDLKKDWNFTSNKIIKSLKNANFSDDLIFKTLYLINKYITTTKFITKFNDNIQTNSVLKKYRNKYNDDLTVLNYKNFVKLLSQFSDDLVFKLINLMLVLGDYKFGYSFILVLCDYYHFGWNNLLLLINDSITAESTSESEVDSQVQVKPSTDEIISEDDEEGEAITITPKLESYNKLVARKRITIDDEDVFWGRVYNCYKRF